MRRWPIPPRIGAGHGSGDPTVGADGRLRGGPGRGRPHRLLGGQERHGFRRRPHDGRVAPSAAGLLLLAVGSFLHPAAIPVPWRWAAPALFGYALLLFVVNAPWIACVDWGAYTFAALLVPFVVRGVAFPRRGEWPAAVGALLFLFGSVVALAFNVTHGSGGIGYFAGWLE